MPCELTEILLKTDSWVRKILYRRNRLSTPVFLVFPCGSAGKESTCNVEDLISIPELGSSPGEGKGYPLQYSGLENSMDGIVHGVAKSRTRLSAFHFTSVSGQGGAVYLCHFEQALILSGPQFLLHNKREMCQNCGFKMWLLIRII